MFRDRRTAGAQLAEALLQYKGNPAAIVLGIPRGGVVVAAEVAKQLTLPLDVLVVRKIGYPGNEEVATGATGTDHYVLNPEIAGRIPESYLAKQIAQKQQEVRERYRKFRGSKPMYDVRGKIVIVVDDGIATGASVQAAVEILKQQQPKEIVVAVPVAPPDTVRKLERIARVVCLTQPISFMAVGQFYADFVQTEDGEVQQLLREAGS